MIECSPDPHFTQTQNTNQESLVKSNSHNFLKAFCGFCLAVVVGIFYFFYFYPEELFGFAIETTIPLVPGEKKKNHFSLNQSKWHFCLSKIFDTTLTDSTRRK